MRVKALLLDALSRSNNIQEGTPADPRDIAKARKFLNACLSTYSDANLVTAFQNVKTITGRAEQVIGRYNMKRGKIMHIGRVLEDLPDPTRLTPNKDYGHITSTNQYLYVAVVGNTKQWVVSDYSTDTAALDAMGCCDYIPDVILPDIVRITAAMHRRAGTGGAFNELHFVPLTSFFTDESDNIYCSDPAGDGKVRLFLPEPVVGDDVRFIYNTSMSFSEDDYIDLPEVYRELLTVAVTVQLLLSDVDADPTQLKNYQIILEGLEHQIKANNVSTKQLVRKDVGMLENLHTGSFIYRRR